MCVRPTVLCPVCVSVCPFVRICVCVCVCVCVVNRELGPRLDAEQKKGLASALGL